MCQRSFVHTVGARVYARTADFSLNEKVRAATFTTELEWLMRKHGWTAHRANALEANDAEGYGYTC